MFLPIPIRFHDGRDFHSIPVVNGLIIVLNVLVFCVGWTPYVGPGTGLFSVVTYAFGHADVWHLAGNMIALLVFGTPVNRRIGNGWYLAIYLGTCLSIGLFVRMFVGGNLLGASGAIFAVIAMAAILMPSAIIDVAYFALFPVTVLIGLLQAPPHWVFWFIRWDKFSIRAWWGLILVPLLEICGLLGNGLNWTNLGHLSGWRVVSLRFSCCLRRLQ